MHPFKRSYEYNQRCNNKGGHLLSPVPICAFHIHLTLQTLWFYGYCTAVDMSCVGDAVRL